jgi:hypothetical protein
MDDADANVARIYDLFRTLADWHAASDADAAETSRITPGAGPGSPRERE